MTDACHFRPRHDFPPLDLIGTIPGARMATYSPNVSENGTTRLDQDDDLINLRPLLDVLFRWWREIVLVTVVTVVIGSGLFWYLSAQTPPTYRATAQVAITRIVTNVNMDDTFQTELNGVASGSENSSRRNSLLGLVKNGTIARAVVDELGALLNVDSPFSLLTQIEAEIVGAEPSDLIEIRATADTPEKAAEIANSWARHYVSHVNILYGEMPTEMADVVAVELDKAETNYRAAQVAYEEFLKENDIPTLSRQIAEKQQFVRTLQTSREAGLSAVVSQTLQYRQDVIATYLQTVQQNRLLALTSEQESNRNLVNSLLDAISANRLLAFTTEQNARVQLFTQYADLELQNRLLAMQQEQNAKSEIFKAYSDADLRAKLEVFNQQVNDKVGALVNLYETRKRIEQLLDDAGALQNQIEQAGEAGAPSNSLPLLLLKVEAYAATAMDGAQSSGLLQIDLAGNNSLDSDAANQAADIAALIDNLQARAAELDEQISQQALALYNNEGYQLLDGVRPEDDALFAAIQEQYLALFDVGELAQAGSSAGDDTLLSQAILAKYEELFGLGALTDASLTISNTSPIYDALKAQYPALFTVGDLTSLGDILASDSALDAASQQKLIELLQPVDDLESYLAAIDVSAQPILKLEEELRTLSATIEQKRTVQERLIKERDLAEEAYNTLNTKLLELTLQRTAAGREVRLASMANPPDNPVPGRSLLLIGLIFAIAGFFLAVVIAFLATYLEAPPFLSRLRPSGVQPAGQTTH
jgi:uncharacterized protein involved in exopolysaccharide biosynthesis